MCRTPREALMLIAEYKSKHGLDGRWKNSVDRMEAQWQDRFDQRLVRLGTKWCSVEEKQAAALESQILVEEAVAKIRVNDFEGTRANLEKASSADKNGYLANYLLGLHFALQNDSDKASGHFKKVLARSSKNTGAMNNLAVCEVKDGKVSTAIAHWERAAELAPISSEIIHNVGRCVFEIERQRITASKSVVDRYRKLYSRLALPAGSSPKNGFIWLLTPPVAPAEARPRNVDPNEVANLVNIGGEGSGFFVAANLLLTNRHVVENETYGMADAIYVSIPAGDHKTTAVRAEVIAVSDEHDLALLRCQTLTLPPLILSAKSLNLGQPVMALGYTNTSSATGSPPQSTQAKVALMLEKCPDTVLCDVAMNPGNSGGPLLDATGKVAGINTFMFLVDRGVSGGVQANSAISFLEENIPGFHAPHDESNERTWPEIASSGAASTVFIEVFFHDAVPVLAAKAGSTRMQGYYFVDDSCLSCKGSGQVPCPNHSCHEGTIAQRSSTTRIVGLGNLLAKFKYRRSTRLTARTALQAR
ncbi:MAG: trypsin-like peptidase domain-containing protein [Planctomycetaceae bacterium]